MTARVLLLTKGLGLGGTERLVSALARGLDPARYRAEVAYVLPWKDALVPELRTNGIEVHCLRGGGANNGRWVLGLRRLLAERRYDLVHTHSPVAGAAARLLAPRQTVLIHTEHNVWPRYRAPTYAANASTIGRNAAVVAVSRGVADSIHRPAWAPWAQLPPVEVLYHGIEEGDVERGPEARAVARNLLGLTAGDLVVGCVASFTPKKDHRSLLAAFRKLREQRSGVKLVLVGAGPLEEELRLEAADLGSAVQFLGTRNDVRRLLPAFDVLALTSVHEGLGLVLVEAMAAGIPCVATRTGGIVEVLTDGEQGLLVSPGDIEAIAAAMGRLLDDPALRAELGRRGVERAGDFGIGRAVQRMHDLYEEVLAR